MARVILRRLLLATLAGAVLAGCAAPAPPAGTAPAGSPPAGSPSVSPPPVSPPPVSTGPAAPAVTLPWPDDDVPALQERVDDGSQPWLLDPSEVALAYAAAAYGWSAAQVVAAADGSTVDVTGPQDQRRTLSLTRQGPDSVWLVTADTPTP